ncbi:MAG: ribose-phosphate pyrophosphokinase [Bdellovibrionota bacterium]
MSSEVALAPARPFKIFSGSSNPPLAEKIAAHLGEKLGARKLNTFSDGEIQCEIHENVRGLDAYVVQSTCSPSAQNLMELFIMGDALSRASTRSLCAVIPYYGYARQDRKVAPRTPITAKLVADLITTAGYQRVIAYDLHAGQIQGFFDYPLDHLFPSAVASTDLVARYKGKDVTIVSPDAGGVERARVFAKFLDAPLAIVDKRRSGPNEAKAMNLIGEIRGRTAIIVDDIIDTAGTLCEAVRLLRQEGAAGVVAFASHGVFSGPAIQRLKAAELDEILITDTIPLQEDFKELKNLTVLSVAPLVAETIRRIQRNDSVSALF